MALPSERLFHFMNETKKLPQKLPFHERLVALTLTLLILFSLGLNIYLDDTELPITEIEQKMPQPLLVEITIKGAVKYPGTYQVPKGSTVQQALDMAEPFETANLKRIKLDSKITRRRSINVGTP